MENKDDLFTLIREELYTAVVGDIMDQMGYLHQFLPPQIRPLRDDMILAGRAMPVLEADIGSGPLEEEYPHLLDKSFGLMLEALDDLRKDEVYLCTGSSPTYALWGELMGTRALKLGAAGAVVNGYSRDTRGILALNFPTFSYGCYAQDQAPRGKVINYRVPVDVNGVKVNPGDIIIGDIDGVCIIPREIEEEVILLALEKARGEKHVQKEIVKGMSAVDAFERYRIM